MALELLILGSGSALPTISSHQTSQVLTCGNQVYLIDCGEGTQVELRRRKVKIQNIDTIFISHLHGDHFFGLVGLISTMHLLGRRKELNIYGPKGLQEIIDIQFKNAGSHLNFEMNHFLVERGGEQIFEDKNLTVTAIPLKHRIPCYGFLFKEKVGKRKLKPEALAKYKIPVYARKSLTEGEDFRNEEGLVVKNKDLTLDSPRPTSYAFCSDTAYYEKVLPLIKNVDLLYHEATFLESENERAKKTFHSTAKEAAKIAEKAEVGSLILGHFSNRYKNTDGFLQEARMIFKKTYLAEEGKVFKIPLAQEKG